VGLIGLAIAYALFVWWFSTGAILMLVRARRAWHPWAMAAATGLAALSLWGLIATRSIATPEAALAGFTYAIVIWGFIEMSFLFGYVTGHRREPLGADLRGFPRFRQAFAVLSFHEGAILLTGLVLIALTAQSINAVGTWTFLILWAMRISSKLNLYLGAPNVSADMLPSHLDYLASYFSRGRVSPFFPLSVTLASLAFGVTLHAAATAPDAFHAVAMTLLATLLCLAILEHWFLVLPIRDSALWSWALKGDRAPPPARETPVFGETTKTMNLAGDGLPFPVAPARTAVRLGLVEEAVGLKAGAGGSRKRVA
jgi:putative photosynthetic complex assembly protein 2